MENTRILGRIPNFKRKFGAKLPKLLANLYKYDYERPNYRKTAQNKCETAQIRAKVPKLHVKLP